MISHPSLPLSGTGQALSAEAGLSVRLQAVLGTRPGSLPWRPDFGCDLEDLLLRPATDASMAELRGRITEALERWLPELGAAQLRLHLLPAGSPPPGVPVAEGALFRPGVRGRILVELSLGSTVTSVEVQP